ncbi:hypothetical protein [Streptomyces sp. NPDC092307]|uniref:hypothetical protein n=1 Tax=Streptomyces sp. NPDC092307 TaxID=3366013 RepID=UPI00380858CE
MKTTSRLISPHGRGAPRPAPSVPAPTPGPYIDEGLITDLAAKETSFQVDKLLALVRELNAIHADEHPYACQMLLRAILDRTPGRPCRADNRFCSALTLQSR